MSRDPRLYVEDMLGACQRVVEHVGDKDRKELFSDPKSRDAVLWNLLVLGEATKNVPEHVRSEHPNVEWRKIAGFRDVLAHGYFGLDEDIVWDVVHDKIPELRPALEAVLDRLDMTVHQKITDEFRARRDAFETRFPAAHRFLVRLEQEGRGHGLVLSTAVNAHLYKGDAFLMYLKLKNPELDPPSLLLSPQYNRRIADGAADRSHLLFPEPLRSVLEDGEAAGWMIPRAGGAFELRPQTPDATFTRLFDALVRLKVA